MVNYEYNALVTNVVDGDTFDAEVDVGFKITLKMRFRMARLNAPEMNSPDAQIALDALKTKTFLIDKVLNQKVIIRSKRTEKYGRYLAELFYWVGPNGSPTSTLTNINDQMLSLGLARKYSW